jgi:hypothetical protein
MVVVEVFECTSGGGQFSTAHDRQQRLAIAFRQTLRDRANGPISPGDVLHRIS